MNISFLRNAPNIPQKKNRIGKFAVSLISPGDILIIDNGTTTGEMSKYIPENMGLTILCYNYYILSQLVQKNDVSIIFPGGYYHPKDQMFESPEANNLIKSHRATKLFLSASGVHEKLGITCAHNYEVLTKKSCHQFFPYKNPAGRFQQTGTDTYGLLRLNVRNRYYHHRFRNLRRMDSFNRRCRH